MRMMRVVIAIAALLCVDGARTMQVAEAKEGKKPLETEFDKLMEIEPGKLWTVVHKWPVWKVIPTRYNRMAIMLLEKGVGGHKDKTLVLVNGVPLGKSLLAELKQLEQDQGATVRYVLSPGDWHYLNLGDYEEPFPEATIYVPPGRIPVEKAKEVKFKYTLYDMAAPLKWLRPALHVQNMDGLVQPQAMPQYNQNSVRNELFFYHKASKTLMAGDLFLSVEVDKDIFKVWNVLGFRMWSKKPEEIKKAQASAKDMLALDFTRYIPVHGGLGNIVTSEAKAKVGAALWNVESGIMGIHGD